MYNALSKEIQDNVEFAAELGVDKKTMLALIRAATFEHIKKEGVPAEIFKKDANTTTLIRAIIQGIETDHDDPLTPPVKIKDVLTKTLKKSKGRK